jgi:hypothetical protein
LWFNSKEILCFCSIKGLAGWGAQDDPPQLTSSVHQCVRVVECECVFTVCAQCARACIHVRARPACTPMCPCPRAPVRPPTRAPEYHFARALVRPCVFAFVHRGVCGSVCLSIRVYVCLCVAVSPASVSLCVRV